MGQLTSSMIVAQPPHATPRFPDFYIVGAPRCGTTFMYDCLAQHPQIFMSSVKEPQHFATDLDSGNYLDSLSFMRDRSTYLKLFDGARLDQLAGEASTWYLYSREAATNIHAVNPAGRIIVMLRDPVEMLYSLHGRRLYGGSEDLVRFEDALAAEDDRRRGLNIPPRARNVTALYYHDVGSYAEQVDRYLEVFGRRQVHVVIFEELRGDPEGAYRGVLEFLGVDPTFKAAIGVVNAGAARRSWRLQQMLLSPHVLRAARLVLPVRARPYVGQLWDRVNSRRASRTPLSRETADALRRDLAADVLRLGELLERDLTQVWPGYER